MTTKISVDGRAAATHTMLAELHGMTPGSMRSALLRLHQAGRLDDPYHLDGRTPLWDVEDVARALAARPGRRQRRTSPARTRA